MPEEVAQKIHRVLSAYPKRKYPKGQIILFADENPSHIFYIVKGKVIKYDISYRGDEVIINVFKPPAFFPLSWAINNTQNNYFYKTDEETELHIVPVDDTVAFLKQNPDVVYDLMKRVYTGMEGMLTRLVLLMSGTAKSRVLHELVIECKRFGVKLKDGSYKLDVSELGLGSRAGMSRETINREMRKLKDASLVRIEKNHIVVNDLGALEAAAGQAD